MPTPLAQRTTEVVTAIWSRWYGLPARATRARLESLRRATAVALRGHTGETALREFVVAALGLPGGVAALEEARPGLGREAGALAAGALAPDERDAIAALLEAEDPCAAGLERLIDQPALLPG
ncbi:MAG: hypothetical protein ACRC1H_08635, partial [Caldilineaceae bacterium]